MPLPKGFTPADVEAIAGDRQSGAWIVMAGGDIFRADGVRLTLFDHVKALEGVRVISALAADPGHGGGGVTVGDELRERGCTDPIRRSLHGATL